MHEVVDDHMSRELLDADHPNLLMQSCLEPCRVTQRREQGDVLQSQMAEPAFSVGQGRGLVTPLSAKTSGS